MCLFVDVFYCVLSCYPLLAVGETKRNFYCFVVLHVLSDSVRLSGVKMFTTNGQTFGADGGRDDETETRFGCTRVFWDSRSAGHDPNENHLGGFRACSLGVIECISLIVARALWTVNEDGWKNNNGKKKKCFFDKSFCVPSMRSRDGHSWEMGGDPSVIAVVV